MASSKLPHDLDQLDYPGRRAPANRGSKKVAKEEKAVWDVRPLHYKMPGDTKPTAFYTIGHLANALGYSIQAVRLWETKGLMPLAPFRSQTPQGKPQAGGSRRGKRLWTKEQIEGILKIAARHKVILNREPPTKAFAADVQRFLNSTSHSD